MMVEKCIDMMKSSVESFGFMRLPLGIAVWSVAAPVCGATPSGSPGCTLGSTLKMHRLPHKPVMRVGLMKRPVPQYSIICESAVF